jgi:CRISPR-associated endonuclease/helicase Cas3
MSLLEDFPAKSNDVGQWLSLRNHLEDTVGVMRRLCMKWVPVSVVNAAQLDEESFAELAVFCAAVHDIGKASMAFLTKRMNVQFVLPEAASRLEADGIIFHSCPDAEKTPHNFASAAICGTRFGVSWSICEVLASHHGRPRGTDVDFRRQLKGICMANYYGPETESRAVFEAAWSEARDFALSRSSIPETLLRREISVQTQMLLTGLLIVADWIASNEDYFPLIGDAPYPKGRLDDGWDRVALPGFWESLCSQLDADEFAERFGFFPRPAQAEIIRTGHLGSRHIHRRMPNGCRQNGGSTLCGGNPCGPRRCGGNLFRPSHQGDSKRPLSPHHGLGRKGFPERRRDLPPPCPWRRRIQ